MAHCSKLSHSCTELLMLICTLSFWLHNNYYKMYYFFHSLQYKIAFWPPFPLKKINWYLNSPPFCLLIHQCINKSSYLKNIEYWMCAYQIQTLTPKISFFKKKIIAAVNHYIFSILLSHTYKTIYECYMTYCIILRVQLTRYCLFYFVK